MTSDQPSIPMRVPLKALFTAFTDSEIIEDFYSSAIQAKTSAMRLVRRVSGVCDGMGIGYINNGVRYGRDVDYRWLKGEIVVYG